MAVHKKFLKLKDVKRLAGVSGSKIYTMVEAKQFPEPIKIGHRSVRWIEGEVRAWIADKINRVNEKKPKDEHMDKPQKIEVEPPCMIRKNEEEGRASMIGCDGHQFSAFVTTASTMPVVIARESKVHIYFDDLYLDREYDGEADACLSDGRDEMYLTRKQMAGLYFILQLLLDDDKMLEIENEANEKRKKG
ncbi:MAG: AlpA family transcriptional regulator [Pseudomonadota bacterium]